MNNELITSRQNPLVKEIQAIRDDRQSPFMFLEGPRLVEELVNSSQAIETLIWTTAAEADPVVSAVQAKSKRLCRVAQTVFEAMSDVKSPQGVLAIVKRPVWTWDDFAIRTPRPILVLDGVQDPGNMATILRTAEASGAAGLVTTPGTARLFSPKALRGAMGSTLRLPILEHQEVPEIAAKLKEGGYRLLATGSSPSPFSGEVAQGRMTGPSPAANPALSGEGRGESTMYTAIDWKNPWAMLLGHEGQGLSKQWSAFATTNVHIPMLAPVESLNVAAAAAILLYESFRQRNNQI